MEQYALLTDATVDLPHQLVEQLDIGVISMPVRLDDKEYLYDSAETELSVDDFYQRVRDGAKPETAQINMVQFAEAFLPHLQAGKDILYICFSSGLSGTIQSALLAIKELQEHFPQRKICCIDSLGASIGEGVLVYNAAKKKQSGMGFEALCHWVKQNRLCAAHWFTVDDLYHLYKGGRLSMGSAVVGTALGIKPILTMDIKGRLVPAEKVRGKAKARHQLLEHMHENILNPEEQTVFVGHGDNLEGAELLAQMVQDAYPNTQVLITKVGPVIGSHTGPGMIGLVFMGKERK